MFETYATDTFKKVYDSLDNNEKEWINKTKVKLKESPTGKPLSSPWFREKKYLNKRLYFLIDETTKRILFVSFAPKKDQQDIINFVKENISELFSYLRS